MQDFAEYVVFLAVWTILVPFLDCGMWMLVTREASQAPAARTFSLTTEADRARLPLWAAAIAVAALGTPRRRLELFRACWRSSPPSARRRSTRPRAS